MGKEYVKAVYHPAYLTYMQSTSWETLGWRKHKLESRLPGNINNLRYEDDTTFMAEILLEAKGKKTHGSTPWSSTSQGTGQAGESRR